MPTGPPIEVPSRGAIHSRPTGISIALCTYDGARFLEPQLESFLLQTRLPDELVVCDDRSSDGTMDLLQAFAQRAPFPVRIEQNDARLGSTRNFEKAIGLCSGDLIATSDQDDVWLPGKLALCEAAFARDPHLGLVFTDAEIVDESLRPRGYRLWDTIHLGRGARRRVLRGRAFDVLLRQWLVTGATMMFRAEYLPVVLPIPASWVHDGWIAFLIGALAPIAMVEQPTVLYRQHAAQQIGADRLDWRQMLAIAREVGPDHFRLARDRFHLASERLHALAGRRVDPGILDLVDRKVVHQARRLAISECPSRAGRARLAVLELLRGGYARFSPTVSHHFAKDLLL